MHTPRFVRAVQRTFRDVPLLFGIDRYKHTEDRYVLEREIFPYFVSSPEYPRVLFVGCAWYTRGYNTIFKDKEFQTLEIDPRESKYGARRHITDGLQNVADHFDEGALDLIICNGVFGWGLNEKPLVEKAFAGCFRSLRPGGVLVQGWNDTAERSPFPLDECHSLSLFQPFVFPPFSADRHFIPANRHIYRFYAKPLMASAPPSR